LPGGQDESPNPSGRRGNETGIPIDAMLRAEAVGGAPGGAVVAVEPARAREARALVWTPELAVRPQEKPGRG